jgi:hypothetical protein
VGERADDRVADDPGQRLRPDDVAHRPGHLAAAEVGGDAREAGRQQAGDAEAGDDVGGVEDRQRRRGRGRRRPGERERPAADDQRPHADPVDQWPDRQRAGERGSGQY